MPSPLRAFAESREAPGPPSGWRVFRSWSVEVWWRKKEEEEEERKVSQKEEEVEEEKEKKNADDVDGDSDGKLFLWIRETPPFLFLSRTWMALVTSAVSCSARS